ncbi:MAG TPA: thioredoxin domain-containing protein [Marmoricola sp.]|nr:thioredoxin domain-containing protein [Marmoricola sp.]
MSTTPDEASERRAREAASRAKASPRDLRGGRGEEPQPGGLQRLLMGFGAVALLGAMVAAALIYSGGGGTVGQRTPPLPVVATAHGVALGKPSAPVHVVVYEEFGSPACVRFEMGSRDYLRTDAAAGRVYVEYRPIAHAGQDASRVLSAFAAVLDSAGAKAAWKFHDRVFERQATDPGAALDATGLATLAQQAGAGKADVLAALASQREQPWVGRANAAAAGADLRQLPTVLVDGHRMGGAPGQVLDRLETEIATKGTPGTGTTGKGTT